MEGRSVIGRLRRHHALEHATLSVLARRTPVTGLFARSDLQGFVVYGEVATPALRQAAEEGLVRLKAGQSELAVHPNCGTGLVTAGVLAGVGSLLATDRWGRSVWERLPLAVLGATVALFWARPVGRWAQVNLTTSADVLGLRIAAIQELPLIGVRRHRVALAAESAP